MRKFLFLLCAVTMVFSVNARPLKGAKTLFPEKTTLTKTWKAKQHLAASDTTLTLARMATKFYSQSNDMYVRLEDESGDLAFVFDIVLDPGQTQLVSGKTYTLADMLPAYTRIEDYVNIKYISFQTAEFTYTLAPDSSFTVVATVLDENDMTWHLSYAQGAPVISYATLDLNGTVETIDEVQMITAANSDSTSMVRLVIETDHILGSFTMENIYDMFSGILYQGAEYRIIDAAFTVTYNANDKTYEVSGTLKGANTANQTDVVIFTIHFLCQASTDPFPTEAKDTVALEFNEIYGLQYYAGSGDYYIVAKRPDYILTLDIKTDSLPGTYEKKDFDKDYTRLMMINGTDTVIPGTIKDAKATIVDMETFYNINAELYLSDTVLYLLHMIYTKPVASDTIRYTFTEPIIIDEYVNEYYFAATDSNYLLQMNYRSSSITGTFTQSDMIMRYCGLYNAADTSFVPYVDLGLVVTEHETGYDITVDYFATDSHYYIFTIRSNKTVVEDTVDIYLENASLEDLDIYAPMYGFQYYVEAAPTDSSYKFMLALIPSTLEGSYNIDDLYPIYSRIKIGKDYYQFVDASFEVTAGEKGSYTLSGWVIAKNNTWYNFVIKTAESAQGINNVSAKFGESSKLLRNGQLFIERNGVLYTPSGQIVK